MSPQTVLLVEDNDKLMKANRGALTMRGFRVLEAADLSSARMLLETEMPDCFVLDILLPDGDGRDFCRELRARGIDVPILYLTTLRGVPDMEKSYGAGGTDFLSKPFDLDHLIMKIAALIGQHALSKQAASVYRRGGFLVDFTSRRAFLSGRDLLLKPKEFSLLELLIQNMDRFISPKEIFRRVWALEPMRDSRQVKDHIYHLRAKLEGAPARIQSEYAKGYRLVIDNDK